jgi:hypothetical protein
MILRLFGFALVVTLVIAPAPAGAADPPPSDPIIDDQLQAQKSAARLCGTWQWTIHNHRSHQEQKTTIVLLPPGTQAPPDMPQPAKMVVMGDAVYLRWDFQNGYQEDSLLFVKEGRHLEGTFTTTTGDRGAITGKRIAGCAASKKD